MKVIATVQSPGNDPVEINFVSNGDELDVMHGVASALSAARDDSPWAPKTLAIRIEL